MIFAYTDDLTCECTDMRRERLRALANVGDDGPLNEDAASSMRIDLRRMKDMYRVGQGYDERASE